MTGDDRVGGLVGWNNGPISSSHATGTVNGGNWVGDLLGRTMTTTLGTALQSD